MISGPIYTAIRLNRGDVDSDLCETIDPDSLFVFFVRTTIIPHSCVEWIRYKKRQPY
ncbi:hypothetical protein GCM10028810_31600 [Spirosoma litoris]